MKKKIIHFFTILVLLHVHVCKKKMTTRAVNIFKCIFADSFRSLLSVPIFVFSLCLKVEEATVSKVILPLMT